MNLLGPRLCPGAFFLATPRAHGLHFLARFVSLTKIVLNPNPAEEIRTVSGEQTFRSKDNALCL
jgi:hypothetical protein